MFEVKGCVLIYKIYNTFFVGPLSKLRDAKVFGQKKRRRKIVQYILEGTARYAGLLLAPEEGFGLRPRLLLSF